MKKSILLLLFLCFQGVFAQLNITVNPDEIKSEVAKEDFTEFFYISEHPDIMCGTYYRQSDEQIGSMKFTTEVEVVLNKDGTCKTKFTKSGSRTVNKTGEGTWGLAVDPKTNKLKTSVSDNGTWYEIVLVSESDSQLPYYDRNVWYDKILIENDNSVYLKFVFSSLGKVKKQ